MNEETYKEKYNSFIKRIDVMEKEFEVLGNAYTMQNVALKNLKSDYETQAGHLKRIKQDLELRSNTEYRNKTTRQLAQEAFNQSTVTANWEGLGKHPVIEDIFEQIKTRYSTEGRRADDVLRKIENQMSVEEFFDQLSKSDEVREIREALEVFDSSLGDLRITQDFDRRQANKQDLKQRDKVADIEHGMNALEFIQDETIIAYDGAFIFLMGALAEMGKAQVEEGLRFMLRDRKPKVEENDGKKASETTEPSED